MARLPARLRPLWPLAKALHTRAAGLAQPLTSRLVAGVPRGIARTVEQSGGRVLPAFAAEHHVRPVPDGVPAGHWRFAATADVRIPEVVTLELPHGRVLGPHAAVITGDDRLVWPASSYFGTDRPQRHPLFLSARTPPVHHVRGRLGVLASRGDANYYHFLLDVLPRLGVMAASGVTADLLLVPYASRFQRELLAAAGVDAGRVLDSTTHPHVRADLLVVPGLPARDLQAPSWVVPWLRERLLPDRIPSGRARLYLTRGRQQHTRRVENEDEVLGLLRGLGYDAFDPGTLSVAEQVAAFAAAEYIVAPHGAALANLAFASPGCQVLELFPADYVNTCYRELAAQVPGLTYRYLVSEGPGRSMAGVSSDLRVDVDALAGLLG